MESQKLEREKLLKNWLHSSCGMPAPKLTPMVGDASMRRYFRVAVENSSLIAMDAPPPQENCRPYVAIANALREINLKAPQIFFADVEQGFLLISDFGDATYLRSLNSNNADELYKRALDALAVLQACRNVNNHHVPPFTADFMWKEWAWYKEWFLEKLLGVSFADIEAQLDECYDLLVNSAVNQPQVFMHRDFHSANLMVVENSVGILDFQDAFIGPVTYDLASILRDCYIDWSEHQVNLWVNYYYQLLQANGLLANVSAQEFIRWFDLMSVQRHLKALLTFGRKHVRDNQSRYLNYVPRTLNYLVNVTKSYPELKVLHEFLMIAVVPTFARLNVCVQ